MLCACMQAYHAVAAALKQNHAARSTTSNVRGMGHPNTTYSHHVLMKQPREDCGVNSADLQRRTDSMVSPTLSPDGGIFY